MTVAVAKSPSLQASLIEALSSDDPERTLEQSFIQLARGGDVRLLLAMLKALVRAGLAGIAVQLIHSAGGVLATEPQLATLADHLASLPTGELEVDQLQSRCRDAVASALNGRPHLDRHLSDVESSIQMHRVFRSNKGNTHIISGVTPQRLEFIMPFVDQAALVASMKLPPITLATSFLFIGVPSPKLWDEIINTREPSGFLPPIDVVEPDAALLTTWLGLIDDPSVLNGDRVSIFVGHEAPAEYRRFLVEHPWRTPATHALTNHRPRWNPPVIDRAFSDSISRERESRHQRLQRSMLDRYPVRDGEQWRKRFQQAVTSGPPLRIAGLTTRFSTVIQHSMRSLATAFKRRGCEFDLVMQPSPSCPTVDVVGALAAKDYDLLVVINHLRFEFGKSMPANVPYLCWIQDHMDQLCDAKAGASIGELDLVLTHSPDMMASLYGYPSDRQMATSNLTDATEVVEVSDEDRVRFGCDVSFAGHGSETPDQLLEMITHGATPAFKRMMGHFLDQVSRRLSTHPWINPPDLLQMMLDAEQETGHPPIPAAMRRARIYPQAARLYDRVFRQQTLQWVSEWARTRRRSFKLFGRGWEKHPTLSQFACGEAIPGEELRGLYRASSINLQINGYSSLHQRLLDALATGGFVLSRYNPADFLSKPFTLLQTFIQSNGLKSLRELLDCVSSQPELHEAIVQASEFAGLEIAPVDSLARAARMKLAEAMNDPRQLRTDEGLFEVLKAMQFIPKRTASDIARFAQTTFSDSESLHRMLDRYADDARARSGLSNQMRQSVLQHDTYDALVDRILLAFAGRGLPNPCAGS